MANIKITQICDIQKLQALMKDDNTHIHFEVNVHNSEEKIGNDIPKKDKLYILLREALELVPEPRLQNLMEAAIKSTLREFEYKKDAADYLGLDKKTVLNRYPTYCMTNRKDDIKKLEDKMKMENEAMTRGIDG